MGKQITFFMTPDDEQRFLCAAEARSDLVFLPTQLESHVLTGNLLRAHDISKSDFVLWCMWNRSITPESDIVVEPMPDGAGYSVNRRNSEVIELFRSRLGKAGLQQGRLWAQTTGKSKDFENWYTSLAGWIRRHFKRRGADWIGPGALKWESRGGVIGAQT